MDLVDIGQRLKSVRTNLLQLSQNELADKLETKQTIISRLESGKGGSINILLDFVTLLNDEGYKGHYLFSKSFSLENLKVTHSINIEQIINLMRLHLEENEKNVEKIIERVQAL